MASKLEAEISKSKDELITSVLKALTKKKYYNHYDMMRAINLTFKKCRAEFEKETAKLKEERDDFLKVLQQGNVRDLKMAKKVKSKKVNNLLDFAETLGLIERNDEQIYQKKEMDENVTIEWNELDAWIDKPTVKHVHVKIGGEALLKALKEAK